MKSIRAPGVAAIDRGLVIHTLGGLTLHLDGEDITAQLPAKVAALAVFLVCEPVPHTREEVRALLWGGERLVSGSTNVRVALTTLRRVLGSKVTISRHTVCLAPDAPCWVDAHQVENDIHSVLPLRAGETLLDSTAAHRLERALTRYQGHFLHGVALASAPDFTAWMKYKQAKYQALAHRACAALVDFHVASGAVDQGIDVAARWVALDPLDETAQQRLIQLYAATGDLQSALRFYKQYQDNLWRAFQVAPGLKMQTLHGSLRQPAAHETASLPVRFDGTQTARHSPESHEADPTVGG